MRTESSELLMNKFNKIVFNNDKNKLGHDNHGKDDKKRRPLTKRS